MPHGWDQGAGSQVDRLRQEIGKIESVANALAALDQGDRDCNSAPGVVLLKGSDLPDELSSRIGSALIVFDGQEIKQADIRYNNIPAYDGTGGGQDRLLLQTEANGTRVFTEIGNGISMQGWNNHYEVYEHSRSLTVGADGEIR